MKKLLLFLALSPILAFAQGGQRIGQATQSSSGYVKTVPGATVTVCVYNSQLSCNSLVSIYSNATLTLPLANPFHADSNGNYYYYAASGSYVEQVTSPGGVAPISFPVTVIGATSASAGGTAGQVQYNNSGTLGGFTVGGDATLNTSTGVLTLATVNSNVGTCGDSTHVAQVTLNAKGLATACTAVAISAASGTVTHTAGSLTLNAGVFGNGSGDIKVDTSITTDGSGDLTAQTVTTPGDGVHPGTLSLLGNTTAPTLSANNFYFIGPNVATFGALGLQFSSSAPSANNVLLVGAPASGVAQVTYGQVTGSQIAPSSTLVTPNIGAATGTSLLATGIVDGLNATAVTTGTSIVLGGTYKTGYTFNQNATAGAAVSYALPTASAGLQYCVGNGYNGSAADTGALTLQTSASGQFIIFTDGSLSATGGYVISSGAVGDFACMIGVDSTHWYFRPNQGTWTKH